MRKRNVLLSIAVSCIPLLISVGHGDYQPYTHAQAQQSDARFFPPTGHTVKGRFLEYWDKHGGLPQQGYPISEEMQEASQVDGKTYTVQYFERAVFEYHPENTAPYDVLLSLLGALNYKERYPNGAPGQLPNNDSAALSFSQTGKRLGGIFREYWQYNGGLTQFGYPISDEFQEKSPLDSKTYTMQYFERAVFEWHPENKGTPYEVLLSQLGTFEYKARYISRIPSVPDPPDGHSRFYLQGSDRYLVWSDNWHLPDAYGSVVSRIMGLDLSTNKTFVISDDPDPPIAGDYPSDPQISGSLVVWQDAKCSRFHSGCERDILGKDLATGTTYQIATGPADQVQPAVAGRTVVWLEFDGHNRKLLAKDLDSNAVVQITSASTPPPVLGHPVASDEYIVWVLAGQVDQRTSSIPVQLFAYERKTGKTTVVAQYSSPANEGDPYTLGDHRVVWRNDLRLNMTDLSTGKTSLLYEGSSDSPTIRGDAVIWEVYVGGGFGIDGVSLKEGDGKVVSLVSPTEESSPIQATIAGDWLVWRSHDGVHINFKLLREAFAAP